MVFYVSQVFFEVGVQVVPHFTDVEFSVFAAMNNIHDVVHSVVELFGDVHLGFGSLDVDGGTDEGSRFAFLLVARSASWCSAGWLP